MDKNPNKESATRLYDAIQKQNVDIGDFDTFFNKLKADDGSQRLVDVLAKNNIDIGTLDEVNSKLYGGTNPAEKKNEKPATELPSGGGSSGLLSVKFGGEDYEVNPTTQEVFKGGKPVTVPQNIKDYIAKNIIGVEPVKETGAVGSDGKPMQPIGATGAATPSTIADKVTAQQIRRGAGGGEEIKVEFTPQQAQKITDLGLNPEHFNNSPLDDEFIKLSKTFNPNVDLSDEKQIDSLLDDYRTFRNINDVGNLAKQMGVPLKQFEQGLKDQAAEMFLDVPEQAIYKIDKMYNEAVEKKPELTKKYQEDRSKAIDFVLKSVDKDISDLNVSKMLGNKTPEEIQKIDKEIADKKAMYNNLLKTPDQLVKQAIKANSSLSLLDKAFAGKDDKQRLSMVYNGLLADLYKTGKDLGYSLDDIKSGRVNLATFFGFGDKGKHYVDVYTQLQQLAPAVLINRSPNERQDNFFDTFANSFVGAITPVGAANAITEKQRGNIINNFLNTARVEPSKVASENLGKKLEDYGFGGAFWGETLGGTAGIVLPAMLGGVGVNAITKGLQASRYTAPLADFLLTNPIGKAVSTGAAYELGGQIAPASADELDFGSGVVGELATMLPVKFKGLAVPLAKLFGDKADDAARVVGDFVKRGVGETTQETAQTLYQIYRDTPQGQSVFDNIKQQFGEPSDILKFAISTFLMGGAMGSGADLGMHKANVDAVNNLTPEDRAIYDSFTGEQRAKANRDIIDIAKDQVSKVPTDNLQAQSGNIQAALSKLTPLVNDENNDYSVEVDGIKYEGTSKEDLQSDIDYLQNLNGIVNDELYKRNTEETPTIEEADSIEQPKTDGGIGVEQQPLVKETPENVNQGEPIVKETVVSETAPVAGGDQVTETNLDIQENTVSKVEERYNEVKSKSPDRVTIIQDGDTYLTFGEDADIIKQISPELDTNNITQEQYDDLLPKIIKEGKAVQTTGVVSNNIAQNEQTIRESPTAVETNVEEEQNAPTAQEGGVSTGGDITASETGTSPLTETQIEDLLSGGSKRAAVLKGMDNPKLAQNITNGTAVASFKRLLDNPETQKKVEQILNVKKIC